MMSAAFPLPPRTPLERQLSWSIWAVIAVIVLILIALVAMYSPAY